LKKNFRSLEVVAKSLINDFMVGTHVSSFKDTLVDIDTTREYQPGDRKLDSRTSLKATRAMSRVFVPEKCMTLFVVLDLSPSQSTKIEQSFVISLYLTYLAELANDSLGLIVFSDNIVDFMLPTQDHRHANTILERNYTKELKGHTNLEKAIKKIESLSLNNAMVLFVSDFCYPLTSKTLNGMRRIASRANNSVASVIMYNEEEWNLEALPFSIDLVDAESGEEINLSLDKFNSPLAAWKTKLRQNLRQARTEPIFVNVNQRHYMSGLLEYLTRSRTCR